MTPARAAAAENSRNAAVLNSLKRAFFSAVLLAVLYPRLQFYWLAWAALVPFFLELNQIKNSKRAFAAAYFMGFFFSLLSMHWVKEVSPVGLVLLCFYQALYFGLFGLIARAVMKGCANYFSSTRKSFLAGVFFEMLVIPAAWVACEWLRAGIPVFGLGWNLLGYSQAGNPLLIQSAKLFGVYGISFLIAAVNTAFFLMLARREKNIRFWAAVLGFLPFVLNMYYGAMQFQARVEGDPFEPAVVADVTVIQGNIEQNQKWSPGLKDLIIQKYLKLTELASFDGPDLAVWPEAAYPGFLNREYDGSETQALFKRLGFHVLVGSPHYVSETEYYNSAYLVSGQGEITGRYDKIHLVPFGEYVPFKTLLSFLEPYAYSLGIGDFSPGKEFTVFEMPLDENRGKARFSVLLCFEDIFPELARGFVRQGAQCLFVITNDAWFGKTGAPFQHLQASVFRAIENGVPVVRAGNVGVSAFISADGEVQDSVRNERGFETYVTGVLTRPVFFSHRPTFYQSYGHYFPLVCSVVVFLAMLLLLQRHPAFSPRNFSKTMPTAEKSRARA